MSNTTTGRIPLWFVGTVAGLAALGLLLIMVHILVSDLHFKIHQTLLYVLYNTLLYWVSLRSTQ